MSYIPQVDDYVRWNRPTGGVDEGWVYFKCEHSLTIEVLARCKSDESIKDCPLHKKIHVLVVCYPWQWHELEYVTHRRDTETSAYHKIPSRY